MESQIDEKGIGLIRNGTKYWLEWAAWLKDTGEEEFFFNGRLKFCLYGSISKLQSYSTVISNWLREFESGKE